MKHHAKNDEFERAVARKALDTMNMMTYLWLRNGRNTSGQRKSRSKKRAD